MATNFGTKIAITGFVRTIATRQLAMVVGRQSADTVDNFHIGYVATATTFWLSVYGVHIGAAWRIRLNRPCVAAMRPYVKLL